MATTQNRSAADFFPRRLTLDDLQAAAKSCKGCELYQDATQTVFGEGPEKASLMFIGEQPGDMEDRQGRPFVGPAGRLFEKALAAAGIPREQVYVTNAVKHFRFIQRGKRRLHQKPLIRQVTACRPWLEPEMKLIKPKVVVCLGATAAQAALGRSVRLTQERRKFIYVDSREVFITIHPSAILRLRESSEREKEYNRLVAEMKLVRRKLNSSHPLEKNLVDISAFSCRTLHPFRGDPVAMPASVYYLLSAMNAQSAIQKELQDLKNSSLYRTLKSVAGEQGPVLTVDGREVLNFSSNNYLGIANHPDLAAAAKAAIDRYGCGSGASRLISGNMTLHDQLEAKLAEFKGTEAALVFNSGFQANTGILATLAGEGDVIFSDALNHASIIDGCRLSRADTVVYEHCNLDYLEEALKQAAHFKRRLIVTETIFSMDGDEAPLMGMVELAERHGAVVMVDEAHATGLYGATGAGVVAKLGLGDRVLVQIGTLGKALGGFGAYVAGSRALRELLINRCRSFIFTTSLPPAVMAMAIAAIDLIQREPQRREALWNNCRILTEGLRAFGFQVGASASPILPLIIGDAGKCMKFSEQLLERGVFAQGIRPPTVPPGTSRLRITLMATHALEHIDRALKAFEELRELE